MSFIDFARSHGLLIDPSRFYQADRIFRCPTVSKPRSDNGAYFWDGEKGWVMDWAENPKPIWYDSPHSAPLTERERKDWFLKRKAADEARKLEWAQVAQKAQETLKTARLDHHPYLTAKGFPDETGMVIDQTLIIPMRHWKTNNLQGYQQIFSKDGKWEKKMLTGMRAKRAVIALGGSGDEIWLTEGYATALSVRAALRQAQIPATVMCCFSANNLVDVATEMVAAKRINTFVFADADEAGVQAGERSFFPFTHAQEGDANDLHQKQGLFAVVQKIIDLRSGYL